VGACHAQHTGRQGALSAKVGHFGFVAFADPTADRLRRGRRNRDDRVFFKERIFTVIIRARRAEVLAALDAEVGRLLGGYSLVATNGAGGFRVVRPRGRWWRCVGEHRLGAFRRKRCRRRRDQLTGADRA